MDFGTIKQNLISLGFGEKVDLEEVEELGYLYDSVNRAISEIGVLYPYIDKYEFEIDESDEEYADYLYIDMASRPGFLDFAETPVLYSKNGSDVFKRFSAYEIEMETTLVIDPSGHEGSYRVYYKRKCEDIDESTPDTFVPELPLKTHFLIPTLAAYWLWLDDDEQKATQYRNLYEQHLAMLNQQSRKSRAFVERGVI